MSHIQYTVGVPCKFTKRCVFHTVKKNCENKNAFNFKVPFSHVTL